MKKKVLITGLVLILVILVTFSIADSNIFLKGSISKFAVKKFKFTKNFIVCIDTDEDGICAYADNCPFAFNPNQGDVDHDNIGDVCDNCADTVNSDQQDSDGDQLGNVCDNCALNSNPNQEDSNGNLVGDVCDNNEVEGCKGPNDTAAGGDKGDTSMLVGQERWEQRFANFSINDFITFLSPRNKSKLFITNPLVNCFFTAVDYHIPQATQKIMRNDELSQILNSNFCELKHGTEIRAGDLITIEAPNAKGLNNFHHAGIILNKNFIFDKPSAGASSARITPIQTLFDEWGNYFDCLVPPWPEGSEYKCVYFRFWRLLPNN